MRRRSRWRDKSGQQHFELEAILSSLLISPVRNKTPCTETDRLPDSRSTMKEHPSSEYSITQIQNENFPPTHTLPPIPYSPPTTHNPSFPPPPIPPPSLPSLLSTPTITLHSDNPPLPASPPWSTSMASPNLPSSRDSSSPTP
jgi:hypothetical protein